jgi:DUF2075 family protein
MAIPNRQIGWSTEANLMWQICKLLQLSEGQIAALNTTIQNITPSVGVEQIAGVDNFPVTGSSTTLYVDSDTGISYYWNGSGYSNVTSVSEKLFLYQNFS